MTSLTSVTAARSAPDTAPVPRRSLAWYLFKAAGRLLGLWLAMPYLIRFTLASPFLGHARAFSGASERIARVPAPLGIYVRQAFYRRSLSSGIGRDVYVGFMTVLSKPHASIGDRVYIGRFCGIGWAHIGPGAIIADHVQILSGRHQHGQTASGPWQDNPQQYQAVSIGSGAWIGSGAIIMADVGTNAIVGAGAVVVKPVTANSKVAGNPARRIDDHT